MSSRRRYSPPNYEARSTQAPGMMKHGSFPGSDHSSGPRTVDPPHHHHHHHDYVITKKDAQRTKMEQLSKENEKLVASRGVLRQQLADMHHEIQRLKSHIKNIETESDNDIKKMLKKIDKMKIDIRGGESLKKDLERAHKEAQSLVMDRQELTLRIQKKAQELQKTRNDVNKIPDLHDELDSMRQEHHRLCSTYEYEKDLTLEQVGQMQAMEKNMVIMARDLEKLRAEVLIAKSGESHMPITYSGSPYIDVYGRPIPMGMVPYGGRNVATLPGAVAPVFREIYDPSYLTFRR